MQGLGLGFRAQDDKEVRFRILSLDLWFCVRV